MRDHLDGGLAGAAGVASVELALGLPIIAVLIWIVGLSGAFALDWLVVQEAAGEAARVAATTVDRHSVVRAAISEVGDRDVWASVTPARRTAGDIAHVTVRFHRELGPLSWTVTGSARSVVEPGVR